MTDLELRLLGGLRCLRNGRPIPEIKTQKGLALLCYLAVNRNPVPRAALAALLWSDKLEADAQMNLRKVLFRLKPLSPYLLITSKTLALNLEAVGTIDLTEFEAAASDKADVSGLQAAVDLYQGDFLDGFTLPDTPLFEEWTRLHRSRLHALALGALRILIEHFYGQADDDTARRYAQRLLVLEPWHEETHRDLMRVLARSGQRSAALVQFETCRAVLAAELAVSPAPATIELYEQIKRGTLAEPGVDAAPATQRLSAAPFHNLPAQTTRLVGREAELAALATLLAEPSSRLITILGLGGMGKTRLAQAVAAAQLNDDGPPRHFPHGIFFVSLAGLEAPDQLIPALAEAMNLQFMSGSDPKIQLLDYARQKAMLLVLDNFEHLRAQASLVDEMLRAAARVKIVVTSREKLNLQAEQLFPIGGLSLPAATAQPAAEQPLTGYGAIQLFCERARRVRPNFDLTPDNQDVVIHICRLVQGMPLGIVLATAWLEMFSPSEVAAEIQASLDFLSAEMEDLPERQRSLRAAFNHAWRLLPERERAVFQRLPVFRGGFTRLAAQAVTGATLANLQGLVSKSLLTVSPEGRYDLHELLRQFAAEQLAAAPALESSMHDAHSAYYSKFLSEQADHWHTGRQMDTLAAVTRDSDNIRGAWQWAAGRGEWLRLLPALNSWGEYLEWRGLDAEGEAAFGALVELAEHAAAGATSLPPDLCRLWAMALLWQGRFTVNSHTALVRLQASLKLIERSELAQPDTRRDKALVLKVLGDRHYGLDRHTARQFLEQSLALYQTCNDPPGLARTLSSLGKLDWATGHYALALERSQAAQAMHQARGDLREQAASLGSLSWIYQHLGQLAEAVRLRRQALEMWRQLGNLSALSNFTAMLSYGVFWQGKFDEALRYAREGLALHRELDQRGGEGFVRLAVCMAQLFSGDYELAGQAGALALARVRADGENGIEASVHWGLGCLALIAGDTQAARVEFAESRRLYVEVQDNYIGLVLPWPGYAACLEQNLARAVPHFIEALTFALALKDHLCLIVALPGVALYLSLAGELVRAVEVWELALNQPFVANSKWYAQVVGQRVEVAVAALAPEEIEAARQRGRALKLWEIAELLLNELQQGTQLTEPLLTN